MTSPEQQPPDQVLQSHVVYLGLGSNLGDRDAHLHAALAALQPGVTLTRLSSVYDTAPLLVTDQPRFHNMVCEGQTGLAPLDLLQYVKAIEARLGRAPGGPRYGPRMIDIDLLFYDQLVLQSPELTLPHPRIPERAFVLAPLSEIAPQLRYQPLGLRVDQLSQRVSGDDIVLLGPLSLSDS